MQTKLSISKAFCGALALSLVLQACGDDDNPTPPNDVTPTAGASSRGGSGGKAGTGNTDADGDGAGESGKGGTTATGGTKSTGGGTKSTSDGGAEPVGGGGAGPDPEPACDLPELGEDGCFNCPANGETKQWLNRCVDSDCEPFDNSPTRLPLLEADGSLPDLPT
jgi:hypothetical protein